MCPRRPAQAWSWATIQVVPLVPRLVPASARELGRHVVEATASLVACLVLLAIGVALLVLGGPAAGSRAAREKGPFAWSLAVSAVSSHSPN